jgi:hypothetical protein
MSRSCVHVCSSVSSAALFACHASASDAYTHTHTNKQINKQTNKQLQEHIDEEIKRSIAYLDSEAVWIKQDIELLRGLTNVERPSMAASRKVTCTYLRLLHCCHKPPHSSHELQTTTNLLFI